MEPPVYQPAERAKQENGEGEREAGTDVRVARAQTPGELIPLVGGHERRITYPLAKNFASKPPRTQTYVALARMIG
jgi:hypothetical protein